MISLNYKFEVYFALSMSYKRQIRFAEIAEKIGNTFANEDSTPVLIGVSTRNTENDNMQSFDQETHTSSTNNFACKNCRKMFGSYEELKKHDTSPLGRLLSRLKGKEAYSL